MNELQEFIKYVEQFYLLFAIMLTVSLSSIALGTLKTIINGQYSLETFSQSLLIRLSIIISISLIIVGVFVLGNDYATGIVKLVLITYIVAQVVSAIKNLGQLTGIKKFEDIANNVEDNIS